VAAIDLMTAGEHALSKAGDAAISDTSSEADRLEDAPATT
jgi:hypothetical protein